MPLRSDHNSGNDKGSDVEIRKFLILEISAHTSANGKSVRLYYDLECDSLAEAFENHVKRNDKGTKNKLNRCQSFMKGTSSRKSSTKLSNFDKCVQLCAIACGTNQTNE